MKKGICAGFLFVISLPIFAGTPIYSSPIFVGKYHCTGNDPYLNKTYTGTVIVTENDPVYKLEMNYDGGEKLVGTGGQYDSTLMSVVFQNQKHQKKIGLEQYAITPDHKVMQGYWVYLGENKLGTERCERMEDSSKAS